MYDSASNTWTGIPSMVAPRGQASTVSFRGKISILDVFGMKRELKRGSNV